ncbi:MAG: DUF1153 domain-containing protein [Micavibrio aeruginosavorus]|uniref:DUF1153 domain-containing protein n=1 Tax=Micavibrio aeruginosavorus TaxID=349221 RepID=A0A2W5NCM4_9BACT|nr:MAG: DUF1153 domain-containing protein [Micavibrio aeruginosavorus]
MGMPMPDHIEQRNAEITLLPPPTTQRWVKSRKLAVIKAIDKGLLTDEQACQRYSLSAEELESWKMALNRHGPGALRTTHINRYRRADHPKQPHSP